MTTPILVLIAVLCCLAAIVVASVSLRPRPDSDDSAISTPAALDAALARQRNERVLGSA